MYEMKGYSSPSDFNEDARRRYNEVIKERTATSYDSWWRVEQVIPWPGGGYQVVWSRPAPLRKH